VVAGTAAIIIMTTSLLDKPSINLEMDVNQRWWLGRNGRRRWWLLSTTEEGFDRDGWAEDLGI